MSGSHENVERENERLRKEVRLLREDGEAKDEWKRQLFRQFHD